MPSMMNLSWLTPIFAQASERVSGSLGELAGGATVWLAVTGLSRSGKTVFVTGSLETYLAGLDQQQPGGGSFKKNTEQYQGLLRIVSLSVHQNIDLWPPFRGAITPLHITLVLIRCQDTDTSGSPMNEGGCT
jgi:hypothetical protein